VTPSINYSTSSYFYIDLSLSLGKNTTFYFAFISPFIVSSKIKGSLGNWTFQNVTNTGSMVLFTDKTNSSDSGPQSATGTFYLSEIPSRNEHGSHTLYFPFQGPLSDSLTSLLPKGQQFGYTKSSIISFQVGIPLKDQIVNSYPIFSTVIPYRDPVVNAPYAQFQFNMNRSVNISPISITYDNSTEEDQWASTQSYGILLVSLGLPTVIFVTWDLVRFKEKI
jgi:hypothetical protein